VTVCEAVPVLPQSSVTDHDLVVENVQPEPDSEPTVPVAESPVEQLSETVAAPNAAATCEAVGLQPSDDEDASEITGASVSRVYVTVCEAVPVLPQSSVTDHDLVVENVQPEPLSLPRVPVAESPVEQLSETVAAPNAAAT